LELLEPEEVILADLGYIGENQIVTPYKNPQHDEDAKMNKVLNKQRVIVENVISRFKQFRSLSTKWRHSLEEHFWRHLLWFLNKLLFPSIQTSSKLENDV
jgi:hypothetical protein